MKANNVIYHATFSVLVIWLILPSSEMKNDISLILDSDTPNCNKVVIEKSKKQKAKSQIGIN